MADALWVSLSGARARMRELDVVANNLANADSVGFKAERTAFAAALARARSGGGDAARVYATLAPGGADLAPGPVVGTGAPLDVALAGDGFFEVETPAGPRYTRAGAFTVDADGTLVTPAGWPVLGEGGGPITVGPGPVAIRASGDVVDGSGAPVGRLRVVSFADAPGALAAEGGNLFRAAPGAVAEPLEEPRLVERSLERSNVRPVEELAALVTLQRAFEISIRAMQSDDDAARRLIQEMS